jgi:inorganic phosphate transporter, PiT family
VLSGLLVAAVALAAVFAWTNGVHDTANAIATALSTGALTPRFGLALATVLNFLGALLGIDVALTVGGIVAVPPGAAGVGMVAAALLAAIGWNLLTWWLGLPTSSSHALLAGLVGAGLVAGATVDGASVTGQVVVPTLLSPVVGLVLAWAAVAALGGAAAGWSRRMTVRRLKIAHSVAAGAVALGHGLQDGQKTMGAIVLALVAAGRLQGPDVVPLWVRLLAAAFLALGTAFGGWPLVRTLGRRVAPLDALGGFAAQGTTAVVLYVAGVVGAPISSTQTVTAAVAGAGAAGGVRPVRWRHVRWLVVRRILAAWVLTPVVCGIAAAALLALLLLGGL